MAFKTVVKTLPCPCGKGGRERHFLAEVLTLPQDTTRNLLWHQLIYVTTVQSYCFEGVWIFRHE